MDMNDRALRNIIMGLGGVMQGVPRESGFDITAAPEIMAILCLAESHDDLKSRLENILVAFTYQGNPVTATSFHPAGALVENRRFTQENARSEAIPFGQLGSHRILPPTYRPPFDLVRVIPRGAAHAI